MSEELTKHEKRALVCINSRSRYFRHWTPKSNVKLVSKGLARFEGNFVFLTDEGVKITNSIKDEEL